MTDPKTERKLEDFENKLGYSFVNRDLLAEALTHRSYYHENRAKTPSCNERLEFLGDSVIGLIVVEYLFLMKAQYEESVLAKMKSYLVCESVLADIAVSISLGRYILLGKGEDSTGGRIKKSILSDALESVIGAVYLDAGFEKTREIVLSFFRERIEKVTEEGQFYDYKTELQEKTQLIYGTLPEYKVIKEQGMEHKRVFTVSVSLDGKELGVASGKKKKEAEALAAKEALQKLKR